MWLDLLTAGVSALAKKQAQDYQYSVNSQQVAVNNGLVQESALVANSAVDTNLVRASYAADGMKQDVEKKEIQAISSARAYAAANSMGAGSYDQVFQNIAVQANAQEAKVQDSLTNEFVNADIERENIKLGASSRQMQVGSTQRTGLQTMLDFGKGALGLLSDTDKRKIASGIGSFLD